MKSPVELNYKWNEYDTYEVWFGFIERIGGGVEVSASISADQFVTFDSLVSSMLSEIGAIILKLGGYQRWALTFTPPPMRSSNPDQTS